MLVVQPLSEDRLARTSPTPDWLSAARAGCSGRSGESRHGSARVAVHRKEEMISGKTLPGDGGWAWLGRGRREVLGCLTFVRGITPEQVIEGYGMDPSAARMLPLDRANEAVLYPVSGEDGYTVNPWIRAGKLGDWAFAASDTGLDLAGYHQEAARHLSAGTEAAVVIWTPNIDSLGYYADAAIMLQFDPGMSWERAGSDPDRFVAEMRRAGLQVERPDPDEQQARVLEERARIQEARREGHEIEVFDDLVATLEMLTLALGIQLPEELARGPLLTVQRTPGGG